MRCRSHPQTSARSRSCSASSPKGDRTMARVKRAVNAHKKRRVVLERASGYRGQRSRLYRKAKEQVLHSMTYAYTGRKDRKGAFRRLWIQRINAAELAVSDPPAFSALVDTAKNALSAADATSTSEAA